MSYFKTSKVGGSDDKESACKAGNPSSIPGLGRPPEEGNPLQYSCLENPMDRGAWRATVHRVCKELDMSERLTLSFSKVLTWVATQVSANRRTNFPGCGVRNSLEWDRQNKIRSLLGDAFHLDKPFKIMSCNSSYQQILFYILPRLGGVKRVEPVIRLAKFQTQLCCLLVMWFGAISLNSICFTFVTCSTVQSNSDPASSADPGVIFSFCLIVFFFFPPG